ncbi:O-antigen ligase family protein [Senegalia massiliensis]|nr:O-antigen ligase family protein [Senegalia massiliensis]
MVIFFHHGNKDFGANISLSDLLFPIILYYFISRNKIILNGAHLIYGCLLVIVGLLTSFIFIPITMNIEPNPSGIIEGYIKLSIVFLYFILGYSICKSKLIESMLKWYSIAGVIIGSIGIISLFINLGSLNKIFYFGDVRFRGIMIDPNFFAVLQVTTLAYFTRNISIKKIYRIIIITIVVASILLSGSKTGFLTFIIYFGLRLFEYIIVTKKSFKKIILIILFVALLILSLPILINIFQYMLEYIGNIMPIFNRVKVIFTDFNSAIGGEGSGRKEAIMGGIHIIKKSPILGVGVGNYYNFMEKTLGYFQDAHNTYIQLFAEYGFVLAFIYYAYIFINICKSRTIKNKSKNNILILRDIIVILLIGSLALSLDNARMYWFYLGAFFYEVKKKT